jgi:hypothetical protein
VKCGVFMVRSSLRHGCYNARKLLLASLFNLACERPGS